MSTHQISIKTLHELVDPQSPSQSSPGDFLRLET